MSESSNEWKSRMTNRGGKRKGAGRKPEDDPRIPLPFRLKTSAIEKAKRLGRDRIEAMIVRANES